MDKLIYCGEPWPSLNVILGWRNPGKRAGWSAKFRRTVGPLLLEAGIVPPGDLKTMKAVMRLYRCTGKELDHDNLWGGASAVVNALKCKPISRHVPDERTWGLYFDDAPTWLELHVAQIKACPDDRPGTYMNIEWKALTTRSTIQSIDSIPGPTIR